jgi:hypothetical protein
MFLLALISTFSTYIPSFYSGFHIPRWVPVVCFGAGLLWGSFRMFLAQQAETERARDASHELEAKISTLQSAAVEHKQKVLEGLVAEVEGNIDTAFAYYSGLPGNRVYLPPSIQFWRDVRGELGFLNPGLAKELRENYAQIERWYGIVDGGARPDIGNQEIDGIVIRLRGHLPQLLEKLKATAKALQTRDQ